MITLHCEICGRPLKGSTVANVRAKKVAHTRECLKTENTRMSETILAILDKHPIEDGELCVTCQVESPCSVAQIIIEGM